MADMQATLPPGVYNMSFERGFWLIRRKSDGKYLPLCKGKTYSRTEFEDHGPPRIFMTSGAAKSALRNWLKGYWRIGVEWDSYNEYGEGAYVTTAPEPTGKPYRNPDDYEVVPRFLTHIIP